MSDPSRPTRLYELLADRALVGLSPEEEAELGALIAANPAEDASAFDRAAAATQLSMLGGKITPMPSELARKIEAAALSAAPTNVRVLAPRRDPVRWAGWIAAAACLVVAVGVEVLRTPKNQPIANVTPIPSGLAPSVIPTAPQPPPTESVADRRAHLLSEPDVLEVAWTATKDPAAGGASGDVVFSVSTQRGFMRFHGLPQNDPTARQYQLWIFDKAQDKRYPIDGGVFDIASNGDVIVPIQPKIRVTDPTLFAVTVEVPGGVVVSKREHIVVTAARG